MVRLTQGTGAMISRNSAEVQVAGKSGKKGKREPEIAPGTTRLVVWIWRTIGAATIYGGYTVIPVNFWAGWRLSGVVSY